MLNKFVIVVPCFNEEKRFNENYFNKMVSIRDTFWIFVDDGSTDSTGEILKKFCNKKNTLCLKVNHNIGKSNAIAQGMQYASSKINGISWLGFLDSDGAFEVSDVENIIQMTRSIKVYNAVYSSRVKMAGRNINRNNSRHIFARLIISFFGLVWKDIPYDTQSGFKLYRYSNNFNLIFLEPFKTKWFFDIELFIRNLKILKSTLNAWEEPVSSWVDIPGSKINYRERIRIIHEVVYIFYLLFRQRKSLKPH
jgi:glycosyltransferase involved in cell wall biosynthesis